MRGICYAAIGAVAMLSVSAFAAPPEAIKLPVAPIPPTPAPVAVTKLGPDTIYDIVCQSDCALRVHPSGLVKVKKKVLAANKELEVMGRFVDGSTSKTYTGPCTVFLLEAAGKGTAEFDVIPFGFKNESEIVSSTL